MYLPAAIQCVCSLLESPTDVADHGRPVVVSALSLSGDVALAGLHVASSAISLSMHRRDQADREADRQASKQVSAFSAVISNSRHKPYSSARRAVKLSHKRFWDQHVLK